MKDEKYVNTHLLAPGMLMLKKQQTKLGNYPSVNFRRNLVARPECFLLPTFADKN